MKTKTKIILGALALGSVTLGTLTLNGSLASAHGNGGYWAGGKDWGSRHGDHMRHKGGYHGQHHKGSKWAKRRHGAGEVFERYDLNDDGKITEAERLTHRADTIARFDTNGDGALSLDEYQGLFNEIMRLRMVRMFQKLDRDGDARVSDQEIAYRIDRMIAWMDKNEDGVIDRDELRRKRHHRKDGPKRAHP